MLDNRDQFRIEDLAWVLLMRLMDHTSGDVYSSVFPFDLSDRKLLSWKRKEEIEASIEFLKDRDLLEVIRRHPSSPGKIKLTFAGKREAKRVAAERHTPGAWFNHTVERLAYAAFVKDMDGAGLSSFAENLLFWDRDLNESSYRSRDMVTRAARYLHDHGLAEHTISTRSVQAPVSYRWWDTRTRTTEVTTEKFKLTAHGMDCVLSGMTVREYLSAQDSAAAGPVFNQNVYGGTAAQGMNVTQNVGVQLEQLASLIHQLRAVAPQLPQVDQEEFLHDIDVLEDANQEPQDRLSAGQRIKAALVSGSSQLGGQAIVATLERITGLITNQ